MLEFSQIAPNLYQGSAPPPGYDVRAAGFQVLVLCAKEFQPSDQAFPGVHVIHCPIDDSLSPTNTDISLAYSTASAVAFWVKQGKRVLVTCRQGFNRSGLVVAYALAQIYGVSGADAAKRVWTMRQGSLFNPAFLRQLSRIQQSRAGAQWWMMG